MKLDCLLLLRVEKVVMADVLLVPARFLVHTLSLYSVPAVRPVTRSRLLPTPCVTSNSSHYKKSTIKICQHHNHICIQFVKMSSVLNEILHDLIVLGYAKITQFHVLIHDSTM